MNSFKLYYPFSFDDDVYAFMAALRKMEKHYGFFGDDKFEIVDAIVHVDVIVLTMSFPLLKDEEKYTIESRNKPKILLIKRS